MSDLQIKIKLVFFPYLLICTCFIVLYTFFHWLLIIKLGLFSPSELLITTGLPLVLCWIPVLIWIVPRIGLLSLYRTTGNVPLLFFAFAAFSPCLPTTLAQQYLIKASGKLTSLQAISQIKHKPITKYYTVRNCYVDKQRALSSNKIYKGDKGVLYLKTYLTCPIYDINDRLSARITKSDHNLKKQQVADTFKTPSSWLGVKYERLINSGYSSDEN
jgi:rhomboid protease GluP